jgi:hypothetical protein
MQRVLNSTAILLVLGNIMVCGMALPVFLALLILITVISTYLRLRNCSSKMVLSLLTEASGSYLVTKFPVLRILSHFTMRTYAIYEFEFTF